MPRRHVVHLAASALIAMVAEALDRYPLETGGILLGSTSSKEATVILRVIGPGPSASHQRHSFDPDNAWQQQQLDTVFENEPDTYTYLGDWHTHPHGRARPSSIDVRAARTIADAPEALQPKPLTMIIGISHDGTITPACFQLANGKLGSTRISLLSPM